MYASPERHVRNADDSRAEQDVVLPASLVFRIPGRLQQQHMRSHKRPAESSTMQSDDTYSSASETTLSSHSSTHDVQTAPMKKRWYAVRKVRCQLESSARRSVLLCP